MKLGGGDGGVNAFRTAEVFNCYYNQPFVSHGNFFETQEGLLFILSGNVKLEDIHFSDIEHTIKKGLTNNVRN